MRLDQFVADVMEQLRDFVPEGGEVHFDLRVFDFPVNGNQEERETHIDWNGWKVTFSAVMPPSSDKAR